MDKIILLDIHGDAIRRSYGIVVVEPCANLATLVNEWREMDRRYFRGDLTDSDEYYMRIDEFLESRGVVVYHHEVVVL